ncbi:MAG: response regulator transcription factor [Lachnospiraceae bacterium]|nr:response regulator transcription factor [Lachnospiraceae bacterium]
MKIGICDDEKEIRELIKDKVMKLYPQSDILLYTSGEELLAGELPDILLLDIQMQGKSGIETAKELRLIDKKLIIIFVTAIEDYVFQAFDVDALHYLVKPFTDEKFSEVLHKAAGQLADRKKSQFADVKKDKPSLLITTKGEHITVNFEDIIYAEVYDRKVIIHTQDADIEYYGKLKDLEEKAGEGFYRPHRAYLVNFDYIRKYDAKTIYLKKGQVLMAKQNYQGFVKSYLRYNRMKGSV